MAAIGDAWGDGVWADGVWASGVWGVGPTASSVPGIEFDATDMRLHYNVPDNRIQFDAPDNRLHWHSGGTD